LEAAILAYGFPPIYFDFAANVQVHAPNMNAVELAIRNMLVSPMALDVKYGLANVIYWGYGQIGYQNTRVARFLNNVTQNHLAEFQALVAAPNAPTLSQIRAIRMPEYSGISFISKILAFINPGQYCVLDQQLARLAMGPGACALHGLTHGTQIRVTAHNQAIYDAWRTECQRIGNQYYGGRHRVVDVERGFFQLIQTNQLPLAQHIYAAA
jgi:hypothetical protein